MHSYFPSISSEIYSFIVGLGLESHRIINPVQIRTNSLWLIHDVVGLLGIGLLHNCQMI
jgi:hypothetical protein